MSDRRPRVLLLALGNDLLGDDGVALAAARVLRERYLGRVDVVESGESGLGLLEILEGFDRVLLLDAIATGTRPFGEVLEFSAADFRRVVAPSPHYAGLPEVLDLGERLGLALPEELRVLAIEVENPFEIRAGFTEATERGLANFVDRSCGILDAWTRDGTPRAGGTRSGAARGAGGPPY
jgi:hydrogenase maturation protease